MSRVSKKRTQAVCTAGASDLQVVPGSSYSAGPSVLAAFSARSAYSSSSHVYGMSAARGVSFFALRMTVGSPPKCAASMRAPRSARSSPIPMLLMPSISIRYLAYIVYKMYVRLERATEQAPNPTTDHLRNTQ